MRLRLMCAASRFFPSVRPPVRVTAADLISGGVAASNRARARLDETFGVNSPFSLPRLASSYSRIARSWPGNTKFRKAIIGEYSVF